MLKASTDVRYTSSMLEKKRRAQQKKSLKKRNAIKIKKDALSVFATQKKKKTTQRI